VGPLPLNPAISLAGLERKDQARTVAREPGLCVLGALGSRGLTWAALLAQVLVAWVEGLPMPVEADLLDAVDPTRWQVRAFRSEAQ
jgi:tRNA 5-methylaminomethyl-2-thiouridine biosynthesis bifunctional protein